MDFQPANTHVRDAKTFGHEHQWPTDTRVSVLVPERFADPQPIGAP